MLLLLENSCRIGGILRCGFKIEKGEGEKAIVDNRGYVKQATAGFLGLLMAQAPRPLKANSYPLFTAIAIAGSIVGSQLAHRLPADLLKRGFGGFLLLIASYILFKSVLFN